MMRAALAKVREWYPELLLGAILAAVAFAGQKDDPLFAVFEALFGVVVWLMCARHKRLPLHEKLDKVGKDVEQTRADVGEVRDIILGAVGEEEPPAGAGPHLTVVR